MARSPGRSGHAWRQLCAQVYREETDCWLCGHHVDQTLRWPHRYSRTVDHVIPLSLGGDPLSRHNAHLAHLTCNSRRGNGQRAALPAQRHSRDWFAG